MSRESSFHTEGCSMESCRPAIIVNFGVAAHWRLWKQGDSAAGIDSWQRVVKQRYLVSPSRFKTPRSAPVTGGWAMAIFQFEDRSRRRSVPADRTCPMHGKD